MICSKVKKLIFVIVLMVIALMASPSVKSCRIGPADKETPPSTDELNCPNEIFISKHFCLDCESAGDALRFAMQRNMGYRPTNMNTVFIGPVSYRFNSRRKTCDFAVPVQTYKCSQLLEAHSKSKCSDIGHCSASHDSVTGQGPIL